MKIIKLVLALILFGVLGLGAMYVGENRGMVKAGTFASVTSKLSGATQHVPTQINPSGVQNSVQTLSSQANIDPNTGAVLGSITVEKEKPPLPQQAFELARYNYCQAVVKDYEERQ